MDSGGRSSPPVGFQPRGSAFRRRRWRRFTVLFSIACAPTGRHGDRRWRSRKCGIFLARPEAHRLRDGGMTMRRRLLLLAPALLSTLLLGAASAADVLARADARQVRAVVETQLDAFARDDAARAFSYAAPSIRSMFGDAERFMDMVRRSYPVVYRPASVAFLVADADGDEVVQPVHFTDASGALWLAVYRLQRQPDRSWRIAGCELAPSSGRTT